MSEQSYFPDAYANSAGQFNESEMDEMMTRLIREAFTVARESGLTSSRARGYAVRFVMDLDSETFPDTSTAMTAVNRAIAGDW